MGGVGVGVRGACVRAWWCAHAQRARAGVHARACVVWGRAPTRGASATHPSQHTCGVPPGRLLQVFIVNLMRSTIAKVFPTPTAAAAATATSITIVEPAAAGAAAQQGSAPPQLQPLGGTGAGGSSAAQQQAAAAAAAAAAAVKAAASGSGGLSAGQRSAAALQAQELYYCVLQHVLTRWGAARGWHGVRGRRAAARGCRRPLMLPSAALAAAAGAGGRGSCAGGTGPTPSHPIPLLHPTH